MPSAGSTRYRANRTARRSRGSRGRANGRWCATTGEPMWAPINSGGNNNEKPRWICCRSRASIESLVQARSVRSKMPKSTRPPPDAHDLELDAWMRGAQPIEQAVDAERLAMRHPLDHRRRGDEIAVHVPLDVRDVVVAQQRIEVAEQVLARPRVCRGRAPVGCGRRRRVTIIDERPFGMGAVQVGVRVDHLRLDPDAELHAEPAHVIDQRRQAIASTHRCRPTSRRALRCRCGASGTSRRRRRTARHRRTRRCRRARATCRDRDRSTPPPRC